MCCPNLPIQLGFFNVLKVKSKIKSKKLSINYFLGIESRLNQIKLGLERSLIDGLIHRLNPIFKIPGLS